MGPLTVLFLRRLAVAALVLAVLLAFGPRLLTDFGVIGPGAAGEIREAQQAVDAARSYGAPAGMPALADALRQLSLARDLAARGERREARRVAIQARRRGIDAQRDALSARAEIHKRAQAVVADVDRRLNELEDLYTRVTPSLDKAVVRQLFGLMKETREAGAGVSLAFEQGNDEKVVADEGAVRERLEAARARLRSFERP